APQRQADSFALDRMCPHHRELFGIQRPGLEEDRVGDRDLSQVVEYPALIQELAVLRREAVCPADRLRVTADALGMMDRVPVTGLDRAREREEHPFGGFEALVQRALPQKHLRPDEKLLRVERFAEVILRSGR